MCEKAEFTRKINPQFERFCNALRKFTGEGSETGFGVPLLCLFRILLDAVTLLIHHRQRRL